MTETGPFVVYPHPALQQAAVARPVDEAMLDVAELLLTRGTEHRVYGLAAAHLGRNEPVALVSVAPPDRRDYMLMFNPRIVDHSVSKSVGEEGSVSLPGIEVDILRHDAVSVQFDDKTGSTQRVDLTGFAARVAQHEIDQVNGVFFLSLLSRLKRETALRRYRKSGAF